MANQTIPDPSPAYRGDRQSIPSKLLDSVSKWIPKGLKNLGLAAFALYSRRLVDNEGNAYSAEELVPRVDLTTPSAGGGIIVINGVSEVVVWNSDQGKYQILRGAGAAGAEYTTLSDIP